MWTRSTARLPGVSTMVVTRMSPMSNTSSSGQRLGGRRMPMVRRVLLEPAQRPKLAQLFPLAPGQPSPAVRPRSPAQAGLRCGLCVVPHSAVRPCPGRAQRSQFPVGSPTTPAEDQAGPDRDLLPLALLEPTAKEKGLLSASRPPTGRRNVSRGATPPVERLGLAASDARATGQPPGPTAVAERRAASARDRCRCRPAWSVHRES